MQVGRISDTEIAEQRHLKEVIEISLLSSEKSNIKQTENQISPLYITKLGRQIDQKSSPRHPTALMTMQLTASEEASNLTHPNPFEGSVMSSPLDDTTGIIDTVTKPVSKNKSINSNNSGHASTIGENTIPGNNE